MYGFISIILVNFSDNRINSFNKVLVINFQIFELLPQFPIFDWNHYYLHLLIPSLPHMSFYNSVSF